MNNYVQNFTRSFAKPVFLLLFITIAAITLNPPHIPDYEDLSDSVKKWVDAADTIVLVLAAVAFGYTLRARKKGHE